MSGRAGGILSDEVKLFACVIPADGTGAKISDPSTWTKTNLKALFPASAGSQVQIKQVLSIPSLGGQVQKVETTCLEDTFVKRINGLKDYGDAIDFSLLYDNTPVTGNYAICDSATYKNVHTAFEVKFKDGEAFYFVGDEVPSMDEIAVNDALKFTMSVALQSDIYYDPLASTNEL